MQRGLTGYFLPGGTTGEKWSSFVPHPLPPEPALNFDGQLQTLHDRALFAIGRLNGIATMLPDPKLLIYTYVRKEAVLSSQIEGTQSSLSDLLLFEIEGAPGVPLDDVREVSRYVAAMDRGLQRLHEGYPVSVRVIKEMHAILLDGGRGSQKEPGEFRRSQNWIGGTRPGNAAFVPPPADFVMDCIGSLEKFLNVPAPTLPALVKVALAHVQFETIHPFLDGNGRVGRLVITLILCAAGLLREPLLYLSLYFKRQRALYYRLLQEVRLTGDWEEWLLFFLEGVAETADDAARVAQQLLALAAADRERLRHLGRQARSCLLIHHALQQQPVTSISHMSRRTGLSIPTVTKAVEQLQTMAIVRELSGMRRNRSFAYESYLKILNA